MEVLKKLTDFKNQFDFCFLSYLDKQEKELVAIDPQIGPVFAQIKKIAAKGKRLRAFICSLGFFGFGGKDKKRILRAEIAMELLQLFALIHDDIMDKDDYRRGEKTINCLFGNSTAILAGDLIFSLAEEMFGIVQNQLMEKYWQKLKKELMVGQYLDVLAKTKITEKEILKIIELKSVSYSVLRPLQIGAALADATRKEIESLEDFALPAGIAFQLQDDLLDFGKSEEASLVTLKGKKYCQAMAQKLAAQARKNLKNVKIKNPEKKLLSGLAEFMIKRKS